VRVLVHAHGLRLWGRPDATADGSGQLQADVRGNGRVCDCEEGGGCLDAGLREDGHGVEAAEDGGPKHAQQDGAHKPAHPVHTKHVQGVVVLEFLLDGE